MSPAPVAKCCRRGNFFAFEMNAVPDVAPESRLVRQAGIGKRSGLPARNLLKARIALSLAAIGLGSALFVGTRWRSNAVPAGEVGNVSAPANSTTAPSQVEPDVHAYIRFYQARVQRDPEDTRSQNALAELYLQAVRETGNEDYLPPALDAARASLAAVGAERNVGGLTALAHAEFTNHDFAAAREHALTLVSLNPGKSEPYAILGDSRLELGDYDGAAEAFAEMQHLSSGDAGTETRLARLAIFQGRTDEARSHFLAAHTALLALPKPPREMVAWCRWQLGETAFSVGDYEEAERHYREALTQNPDYFRALASLGRLQTARGDLPAAIDSYERAVRIVPVIDFMAALGDLYLIFGRSKDAEARYELAEQLGEHSRIVHKSSYDRNLAIFHANHDSKLEEAYATARDEYAAGRRDIYSADTLAWTALKAGRLPEAQSAIKEALKLRTRDAKLFYHAGMIARAAGDRAMAIEQLQRALALNPGFDPRQSLVARQVLQELSP